MSVKIDWMRKFVDRNGHQCYEFETGGRIEVDDEVLYDCFRLTLSDPPVVHTASNDEWSVFDEITGVFDLDALSANAKLYDKLAGTIYEAQDEYDEFNKDGDE